jgi:hypothetical protein
MILRGVPALVATFVLLDVQNGLFGDISATVKLGNDHSMLNARCSTLANPTVKHERDMETQRQNNA